MLNEVYDNNSISKNRYKNHIYFKKMKIFKYTAIKTR